MRSWRRTGLSRRWRGPTGWFLRRWGTGSRNGGRTTRRLSTRRHPPSSRRRTGGCAPSCERPGWRSSSEKSGFLLRAGVPVTTRYAFIHREEGSYPITMMCRCLKVSRSGYYAWLGREPSRTVRRRKELSALIEWVLNSSRGTYGYRRTHAALARRGVETSPDTVRTRHALPGPGGRTATPKGPGATVPAAGPGLAPRPGPAELHRQQAGRAGGWAISRISVPGRGSCTWRPSPAAARRKQSGTRLGRQHAHRLRYTRRSIWRPAGARTRQEETVFHSIPLRPGVPVHLRAARPASGEI